jgi:hypothetical protein
MVRVELGAFAKLKVTNLLEFMFSTQLPIPAQLRPHPLNLLPASGAGVTVTTLFKGQVKVVFNGFCSVPFIAKLPNPSPPLEMLKFTKETVALILSVGVAKISHRLAKM